MLLSELQFYKGSDTGLENYREIIATKVYWI